MIIGVLLSFLRNSCFDHFVCNMQTLDSPKLDDSVVVISTKSLVSDHVAHDKGLQLLLG